MAMIPFIPIFSFILSHISEKRVEPKTIYDYNKECARRYVEAAQSIRRAHTPDISENESQKSEPWHGGHVGWKRK